MLRLHLSQRLLHYPHLHTLLYDEDTEAESVFFRFLETIARMSQSKCFSFVQKVESIKLISIALLT